jgi:hypothetical protein
MKQLLLFLVFVSVTITTTAQVIFYESFNNIAGPTAGGAGTYTFPPGWRLRNVDNRTPDAQVSYVNEAWERREDFGANVADSCAFSTSYYSPVGAADDWMWTPLIGPLPANAVLSWRAKAYDGAYPDGYQVRIMTAAQGPPTGGTGVLGNQVTGSTQVFSTAAENNSWTTRTLSLNAYAGQAVYIAFRNISNDKFILVIDDVKVEVIPDHDAQTTLANNYEFSRTPLNQVSGVALGGSIKNNGNLAITNVALKAEVYNSSNAMVYTATGTAVASLAPGVTQAYTLSSWSPAATGTYSIKYFPVLTEGEDLASNDTLFRSIVLTDSVYARDDGVMVGQLGIGSGDGYMGQSFTINTAVEARSVTAMFVRGYVGRKYAFVIWNTNGSGVPTTVRAATDTLLYPDNDALLDTIPIHGGFTLLSPGKYVVTAIEFDSTLQLAHTATVYTAGTLWTKWSANPAWTNLETFGAQFAKPFYIRLNVNLNSHPPVITSGGGGTAAGVNMVENNTAATTVIATDADNTTPVYYALNGGADASKFSVNATTGALSFITAPDFEDPGDADENNTYIVVVRASDGVNTDEQTITITVTDGNDIAPVITSDGGGTLALFNIPENTTAITTVSATDADAGTTITYSLSGGADAGKFTINSSTGALSFVTAPDFENPADADVNNTYVVRVRAHDGVDNDEQEITVTITAVNDNTPLITSNALVTTAENITVAATVTATDADAGTTLIYSLNGGIDAAKFSINSSTGVLSFVAAPDFETPTDADANNTYIVIVRAGDGTHYADQSITVTVINANDNTPVITSNGGGIAGIVSITENTSAVTIVSATDMDAGTTLIYSLNGGDDAAKFSINTATGALSFLAAPDFENPTDADANNSYIVIVRAGDGANSDDQVIVVNVTNANDNNPVITSNGGGANASVSIMENTANVATVTATDADAGSTIMYSIVGGVDAAKFSINSSTGVLSFLAAPDFENPSDADANNIYIVTVRAGDGVNNDDQSVAVTVSDANDNAPVITSNGGGVNTSVSVAENTTAVTTVIATDADAGSTIVYSINGGADAAKFSINSTTGVLTFTPAADFENPTDADGNNSYIVIVRAGDGINNDDQVIVVAVTNANDNNPVITSNGGGANALVSIMENTANVATVTATDADAGSTITYNIVGGADAAKFNINTTTGTLSFIATPDFESPADANADNGYIVIVRASDGVNDDDQVITITVSNINDNSPAITSNGGGVSASLSIVNPQQSVTTVTASDADGSLNSLVYSIAGGADAADLTIDAVTGALSFIQPTDYNAPTDADLNNSYIVVVQVSDGAFTDQQQIIVTVTGILPVTLVSFKGYVGTTANELVWVTAREKSMEGYEVQQSADAITFKPVAVIAAKNDNNQEYRYTDVQPYRTTFYRLAMKNTDGTVKYSTIIKLDRSTGDISIKAFPNPVRNGLVNLQFTNVQAGRYGVELYSMAGQVIMRKYITHPGTSAAITLQLPSVSNGSYVLRIKGELYTMEQILLVE